MRILMLDLDTLRPDHLGCYGYNRNTSPTLDGIAADGMRFTNYYCSDAPCLPSRAALTSGMFGIHNGAVNHGGNAAELRSSGESRGFNEPILENNLFFLFRRFGLHTATISSFAERHSSYWFNAGFNEVFNCGKRGEEYADEVLPTALDWLNKNADKDNWFLHMNMWDPHTPYRAPEDFGNPFENQPGAEWITEEVFEQHLEHVGPHSANEISMYNDHAPEGLPRQPGKITNLTELKSLIDSYDCGIKYMDDKISAIIDLLKKKGLYDDMVIIVTSDHGENMGELGIYSEHATADNITPHIPMLIKWPGMKKGIADGLHYNLDLAPTIAELLGLPAHKRWDGKSYADTLKNGTDCGRDYLVLSQCAHVCQRSVRFDDYIYIRTYHDGYHLFPKEMLFNIKEDFYEQHNLALKNPELCDRACRYLTEWQHDMLMTADSNVDPMWTVIKEGGPHHAKGHLPDYCIRLENTGRADGAKELRAKHPYEFKKK